MRFTITEETAWCPGCGNFGIRTALADALEKLGLDPSGVLFVSGIGQAAKLPHYLRANTFNGLHGRTLPVATAARLANHDLTVIVTTGDGDAYGEGGNHLLHTLRRNPDLTMLVHDNRVYGLTKGQASPTSDLGMKTKIHPRGVTTEPLNPLTLAIAMGGTFVARGYAGDIAYLSEILQAAIRHRGFSLVDILQPCVSFNHLNTFSWYNERVYRLSEEPDYDPSDPDAALSRAGEWGERIPTGVLYESHRAVFEEQFPVLAQGTLIGRRARGDLRRSIERFR